MAGIEDNLKSAWQSLQEKKKIPSVEKKDKDDKIKNSEEKLTKKEISEEKIEKKEESLEEIAQETTQNMPSTSSPAPRDFFSNQPSEKNDVQRTVNTQKAESEERMTAPYIPTPKNQEEINYSPGNQSKEIPRVERPMMREQRTFERNPLQEHKMFERTNPIRRIISERITSFSQKTESPMSFQDEFQSDKPYEPFKTDPLERKYKLLK